MERKLLEHGQGGLSDDGPLELRGGKVKIDQNFRQGSLSNKSLRGQQEANIFSPE